MSKTDGITPERAKELLEKEKQERIKRCREKIEKALQEEKCVLDVSMLIKQNGIIPQINIITVD